MTRFNMMCVRGMTVCACLVAATVATAAQPTIKATGKRIPQTLLLDTGMKALSTHGVAIPFNGGVAGDPLPGTAVYINTDATNFNTIFQPGAGANTSLPFMSDDLKTTEPTGSEAVYYSLEVAGIPGVGSPPTFDMTVGLNTITPCGGAPEGTPDPNDLIAGTAATITGVPLDGFLYIIEVTLDPGVNIPETVHMHVKFNRPEAGWRFGLQAELGTTGNSFGYDPTGAGICSGGYAFTGANPPYAGFVASIRSDLGAVTGACCTGTSCSITDEAGCGAGTWLGANTDCSLNPCDETFLGYLNEFNTFQFTTMAAGETFADDALMADPECELAEIEIELISQANAPFSMTGVLHTNNDGGTPDDPFDDLPGTAIAGTSFTASGLPGGFSVTGVSSGLIINVNLPAKVWLVFTTSDPGNAGPLLGLESEIGESFDGFAISTNGGAFEGPFFFGGCEGTAPEDCPGDNCVPCGSFNFSISCRGTEPTGACCNDANASCQDDVTLSSCIGSGGRFAGDATCASSPFVPPCGTGACCFAGGICENQTEADCDTNGGGFTTGEICGPNFICPPDACIASTHDDCLSASPNFETGCSDLDCCAAVCNQDSFCCDFEWDNACADIASLFPECTDVPPPPTDECTPDLCVPEGSPGDCFCDEACCGFGDCCVNKLDVCGGCDPDEEQCPAATIVSSTPASGTTDARQPFPPAGAPAQGIQTVSVTLSGAGSADLECWTYCENPDGTNAIASVTNTGGNTFAVTLTEPLSPNTANRINYGGGTGGPLLIAHPANANGDSTASAADVLFVIDMLNGVASPPFGVFSQDIDHSGAFTPADILRTVDLLNGAAAYDPQNFVAKPVAGPCL